MIFKVHRKNPSFFLSEVSRKDLISKSRKGSKERYQKRLNYQVSNFRGVDLDKFFNKDYFVYESPVKDGEYVCTIAFPGVLTELRDVVKGNKEETGKQYEDLKERISDVKALA